MIIREPPNRVEWAKASIRKKNYFSNASWLSVRISSWLIIREPRTVEWAKASIEKKNFKFKSGRVGSGRVSNLELVGLIKEPRTVEWAKASIRKKFIFQCKFALGSNLELGDNKKAPEPRRVG